MSFKLPKSSRLNSRKDIAELFKNGGNVQFAPLALKYRWVDSDRGTSGAPFMVLFSVPKRKVKLAVDRNRIKRLLRETFRHQQGPLKDSITANKTLHIAVIYMRHNMPAYDELNDALSKALSKLNPQK